MSARELPAGPAKAPRRARAPVVLTGRAFNEAIVRAALANRGHAENAPGRIAQPAAIPTYRVASDPPAELTENCGVSERVNRYSGTPGLALGPARRRLEALGRARRDASRRRYATLAEANRARQRAFRARRRGPMA